jgi:integrase
MRFLTPDEVATLAEAMDPRYHALVLLARYGGLRWGELAALRRARVDALRRIVMVVEQVQELDDDTQSWGPPSPLPDGAQFHCRASCRRAGRSHRQVGSARSRRPRFPSPHGAVLRNGLFHRRFWAPAISRAGFEGLRIHDMRHTAVGLAIATGAHAKALQACFGHASITVTLNTYGHLLPGQDEAIADALDALARPARPCLTRPCSP